MSCIKYKKYKTSRASTKSFLVATGAIDEFNNILNQELFNYHSARLNQIARERYPITEDIILKNDVSGDTNNVVFNTQVFHQIDAFKGIFYKENAHLKEQELNIKGTSLVEIRDEVKKYINNKVSGKEAEVVESFDFNKNWKAIEQIHEEFSPYRIFTKVGDKVFIDPEPAFIAKHLPKQEGIYRDIQLSRNVVDLPKEEISVMDKKLNLIKRAFPDVHIILDDKLDAAGALLGNEDKIKQGFRPEDKVISINPNLIQADTVIHEFGHLYIDLLGGLNNPRIRTGIEELRGSELWNQVQDKYPELSEEMLGKEVLATAIGIEGSGIFGKGRLDRIIDWILTQINKLFGINKNTARDLAKEILNDKLDRLSGTLEVETQYAKRTANQVVDKLKRIDARITRRQDKDGYIVKKIDNGVEKEVLVDRTITKIIQEYQLENGVSFDDIAKDQAIKRGMTPEEVQAEWDEQAEIGTRIHDIVDGYINRNLDSRRIFALNRDIFDSENTVKMLLSDIDKIFSEQNLRSPNTLHETKVYDPINDIASTIDIVKIKEGGKAKLIDIKTKKVNQRQLQRLDSSIYSQKSNYSHSDMDKATVQVLGYGSILHNMENIEVDEYGLIPIEYTRNNEGKIDAIVLKPYINIVATDKFKENFETAEKLFPRETIVESTISDEDLEKLENLKTEIINVIKKKKDITSAKYKDKMEVLVRQLEFATGQDFILTFLKHVHESLSTIQFQLNRFAKAEIDVDINYLLNVINTLESYSVLTDVSNISHGIEGFVIDADGNWEAEVDDKLIKGNTNELLALRNRLLDRTNKIIVDKAAEAIEQDISIEEFVKSKGYEAAYEASDKSMSRPDFIRKKLEEDKIELADYRKKKAKRYLSETPRDIDSIDRAVTSPILINNHIVKHITRLLDLSDLNIQMHIADLQKEVLPIFNRYAKNKGPLNYLNTNTYYDDLISKDKSGKKTEYLISKYKAEFEILRREALKKSDETNDPKYRKEFYDKNTTRLSTGEYKVNDEWLDSEYKNLSKEKKELLDKLYDMLATSDNHYENRHRRVIESKLLDNDSNNVVFYKLPAINKTLMDRVMAGTSKEKAKQAIKDLFTIRPDDEQFGNIYQDAAGHDLRSIPINFRTELGETREEILNNQSYSIMNIIMMDYVHAKNFAEKRKIEDEIGVLTRAINVKNSSGENIARTKRDRNGKLLKNQYDEVATINSTETNWYKLMQSIIDHRMYGRMTNRKDLLGVNLNKMVDLVNGWTAHLGLFFNVAGGVVNYTMGEINTGLETIGNAGDFTKEDLLAANKKYYLDSKNVIGDIGSNVKSSQTNLLLEFFNVIESKSVRNIVFENNSRTKNVVSYHSGNFINETGEHVIQSKVMYAVLNKYKVTNANGEYIDSTGNVVSKENAATIDQMFIRKTDVKRNGETITIDSKDVLTDDVIVKDSYLVPKMNNIYLDKIGQFVTPEGEINHASHLALQGKITNSITLTQGNYKERYTPMLAREWYGPLLFLFRRWLPPAYQRRFEGITKAFKDRDKLNEGDLRYDEENFRHIEGYYTTAARFIYNAAKDLKNIQATWNTMSEYEKGNAKRFATEIIMSIGFVFAAAFVGSMAKGADDDDDKQKLYLLASILKRSQSEMNQYINPLQLWKIISSPTVDIATIGSLASFLNYFQPIGFDYDEMEFEFGWDKYERGKRKGDYKWEKQFEELVPIYKQISRDYEESYKFLIRPY